MIKKILTLVLAAVLFATIATTLTNKNVSAQAVNVPDYFCHANNSSSSAYVSVPFSTGYKEIDGQGANDHSLHTGPVVTTQAQAELLKDAKIDWGDIIPPIPGVLPNGLNWPAGESVWNEGCDFPDESNYDTPANIVFTVKCSQDNKSIVVSIANIGDEDGTIYVNGEKIAVEGNTSTERTVALGVNIVITDGESKLYDKTPVCETDTPEVPEVPVVGGRGSGTPTPAPTTSAEVLPFTAGVNYMAVIGAIAASAVALSLSAKKLYSRFF